MSTFEAFKALHMACAFLSMAGFAIRGYWMVTEHPALRNRFAKTLPHVVDTLLRQLIQGAHLALDADDRISRPFDDAE